MDWNEIIEKAAPITSKNNHQDVARFPISKLLYVPDTKTMEAIVVLVGDG